MKKIIAIAFTAAGLLVLPGCQNVTLEKSESAQAPTPSVQKWEYTRFIYTISATPEGLALSTKQFNDMGEKGWEVITVLRNGDNDCIVYLKRPKK